VSELVVIAIITSSGAVVAAIATGVFSLIKSSKNKDTKARIISFAIPKEFDRVTVSYEIVAKKGAFYPEESAGAYLSKHRRK